MFTGIIEEIGKVASIQRGGTWCVLTVRARTVLEGVKIGDSIAVNGVCLTVTSFTDNHFTADVMPETFDRTNLSSLAIGSKVNLERAMPAGGRFGGHLVSGHVDGQGTIQGRENYGNAVVFKITADEPLLYYMIPKGSITIDGISLTLLEVESGYFSVSIIPHTLQQTTLFDKGAGTPVNLECDIVGKYIEKFISARKPSSGITASFLSEHGFM